MIWPVFFDQFDGFLVVKLPGRLRVNRLFILKFCLLGMARSGEASGPRAEAVLTCPGEIDDPNFPQQCSQLLNRLQTLLNDGKKNPTFNLAKFVSIP